MAPRDQGNKENKKPQAKPRKTPAAQNPNASSDASERASGPLPGPNFPVPNRTAVVPQTPQHPPSSEFTFTMARATPAPRHTLTTTTPSSNYRSSFNFYGTQVLPPTEEAYAPPTPAPPPRMEPARPAPQQAPRLMTPEQYAALEARCRELEEQEARRIAAERALASSSRPVSSKPIPKPKGEAGDAKRGFHLQSSMGLGNDDFQFNDIQRGVRSNATKAGVDMNKPYREQDAEVLGRVFKAGRQQFPYLSNNRFAHDWPQAEILKQYMKNRRRYAAKKNRERQAMLKKKVGSCQRESIMAENNLERASGSSRPTKRRRQTTPTTDDEEDESRHNDDDNDDDDIY
ncbi:hypothetical protein ONZ45_g11698 [Pleurotus djamor]|nr:hypothetical protein ONZ45_g11698 [Pleurotus djamor]